MEAHFSSEILCKLHASNLDERLTGPLYTATLLITNRNENEEIVISLFKTFENLTMLFVSHHRFQPFFFVILAFSY